MEQHPPSTLTATPPIATSTTATTAAQPTEVPPPQTPHQQLQQEQSVPPPPSAAAITPTITTPNSNPNRNPNQPPQSRPSSFSRPWQQQQQQYSHFAHFASLPYSSSSSSAITPPIPPTQRGGIAIGVPATHPTVSPPQPAAPFSAPFGQQFGGLGRAGVNVPDSVSPSQVRPQVQGMQGMGMMGSLGPSSQMQPGGISAQHHQQNVQQSSLRPPPSSPNSQSPSTQNFQGQGLMRVSSVGSPCSPSPSTSQSTHNQPWLSSGPQGKPPLPPPTSYRPQMNSPSMQQRSHIPQPHIPLSTASQQQHVPSVQPQPKPSLQLQEQYGQQFPSTRVSQSLPHQQQITRAPGSTIQKPSSLGTVQPTAVQAGTQSRIASAESDESGNRILGKRSINELVNQLDPSERLDSEVEDILVDIAEDFVDSITTFGCSLAKHRKSDTLEAKDILLHLERNWNMMLPGFSGDEIKTYRKPLTNDIHKERLAVIKKSIMATEVANTKTSVGQVAATAKGNLGKIPPNIIGST